MHFKDDIKRVIENFTPETRHAKHMKRAFLREQFSFCTFEYLAGFFDVGVSAYQSSVNRHQELMGTNNRYRIEWNKAIKKYNHVS